MGYLSTRLDQLAFKPDLVDESDNTQDYLIFLIGGNPGLISYYEPFLSTLHALLSASAASESAQFYFYANSLAGFENAHLANGQEATGPVGLQQQIENTERLIINRIRLHQKETETETETKDNPPKVILMGHSVGAYILLEIICRHKETVDTGLAEDFDLIGGILLFPTIVNIAKSPMGIFASQFLRLPRIAQVVGAIARFWANAVPESVLYHIIKIIMRFPEHAARTTIRLLKSPMGVTQALYLAKDEMDMITSDRWTGEVWGAASSTGTNRQDTANFNLIFYWGQGDQWVANHTRDDLIAARGHRVPKGSAQLSENWKPTMFVDEDKIPHGFCIKHSEIMAQNVSQWVKQIIEVHKEESSQTFVWH